MKDSDNDVLDGAKMDGPTVQWTVADLFCKPPKLAMLYHVMVTGYDVFTPVGVLVGGLVSCTPLGRNTVTLRMMANGGLLTGCTGTIAGLVALSGVASKGEEASPPWSEDGIQQRVNGLQHNYKVRVLDKGVWLGIAAAGSLMAVSGGPLRCGLHSGTWGVFQAISLGSAVGSVASMGCIYSSLDTAASNYDDDDDE